MKLNNLFKKDLIIINKSYPSKKEALEDFAQVLVQNGYADNKDKVVELAIKRENETTTGIGDGIAIPHIRDEVMKKSVIFFSKVNSVNWDSLDGKPVDFVFFIALNPNDSDSHVEILAHLMKLLLNTEFKNGLQKINTIDSLINLIEKYEDSNEENNNFDDKNTSYDVVAVTACPTGIAHTFMARDMLNQAAKNMGIKIKVETQGADGIKNELTNEDIKNAKGVIIACDRVVELSKFSGHPNVLEIGTKPVIKNAEKEIQRILNGEGEKFEYKANVENSNVENNNNEMSFKKFGKRSYKSLMTGVSYMLPFVIFGGILIALAFLFDMKNAGSSSFGSGNPISMWMKKLGDLSFGMLVPILAAYISFAIVGRQGLLPGFIVGLIAKGDFFLSLNPDTGNISWLEIGGANSGVFGAIGGAFLASAMLILFSKFLNLEINSKSGMRPWFPSSLSGIKNILIIPLFGTLLIAISFWILNIPLIYLNWAFTKFLNLFEGKTYLAWLLGMILGAMMSVDLGGPINKAAYVFGTTSLTTAGVESGGTISMAAAMAGGMTAPLGIALSCTFFKNLWTKEDRESGFINYIMGATFISEGAIPLTLKNPKVMIPSNIIGSAVAGLLIGALGVKIAAPHGGLLTVALAKCDYFDNPAISTSMGILFFILSILAGAIVSMFCILMFSKIYKNHDKNNTKTSIKKTKSEKSLNLNNTKQKNKFIKKYFNFPLHAVENIMIKKVKHQNIKLWYTQ